MIDRITSLDRRIGLAVVAVVVLSVVVLASCLVTSSLGGDGKDGDVPAGSAELGLDGEPLPQATLVARAVARGVAATIEAMPTPTPLPTPDIAATLQVEMELNRGRVGPVVVLNPLDLELDREPYLTPAELRYFRELGPRLWDYTQVWFHLKRVLSVDIAGWDLAVLQHDLGSAQVILESAPPRMRLESRSRSRSRDDDIDPVVQAYAESIEAGMTGVREAVARLSDAEVILSGGEVGHEEREELLRISRDVEGFMSGFDDAMSAYGCSVCGELFRRVDE